MCQLLFIHHFLYPVQDFNDRWELIPVKYHRPVFSKSMKHAITTNKSMECTEIPVLWLLCKNSRIISLTRTTMSAWKNDVLNTTRWLQTLQHRHLFNHSDTRHRDCTNDFAKMAATTACMQCDVILCQVAVYQPYLSICIYNALCLHYFCTLQLPKNKGLKSLSCKAIFKWESRPCSWYLLCNSFIL